MQDPSTKKEEAVTTAENNQSELVPVQPADELTAEQEDDQDYLFHDAEGGEG